MTQEQYNTVQRKFQHLTREKRAQIEIMLYQGLPSYTEKNFETVFKSVISDNVRKFIDLGRYLPKSIKVYYAHPYSSY